MKSVVTRLMIIGCILAGVGLLAWAGIREKDFLGYLYLETTQEGKAIAFTRPSDEITFESGGLVLHGSVYLPSGKGPFPGIVFTHGGTAQGRKLPLYQLVCRKLSQRGYAVLSFDFRGYGESDDPKQFETTADFDFIGDVKQAVSYLSAIPAVDSSQVYLAGHSFGAGVIIPAGIEDKRIQGIISIAPGRRGYELMWRSGAPAQSYPRHRLANDMQIPELKHLPIDFINPILQYVTIDTILAFPQHPPLLLIDGALEGPKDLAFLRELQGHITEPKTYVTIENADHYFGVNQDEPLEGRYFLVTHWPETMQQLVGTIDNWIKALPAL